MDTLLTSHLQNVIQSKRSMEEAMNVKISELDSSMESLKRFVLVLHSAFDEFEELREMQVRLAEQSGVIDAQIQKLLSVRQNEEAREQEEMQSVNSTNNKSEDECENEPQNARSRSRT